MVLLACAARRAAAQDDLAREGALNLLLPVGARAVGMGQAVMGDTPGTESVWWNPSALARLDRREAAIHHSQSIIGTGDAVTIVFPSALLGALAASVNILNYGEESVVDPEQGVSGTILPRSLVYAATYATAIGRRLNAGVTYKIVQFRLDCTGVCGITTLDATTSALDVGAQYDFKGHAPVVVGFALRNAGLRLQVKDREQADPLPTRLQFGALYQPGAIKRYAKNVDVRLTTDILTQVDLTHPSGRIGTDVVWQKKAHFRAGYVIESSDAAGPSLGVGLETGSVVIDVARIFEGLSAESGQAPTYFSLQYLF